MTMTCGGLAKLIEECGELVQVAGKKLACYSDNAHWDGSDLKERMEDEMGDVKAAIAFVTERLGMSTNRISAREFKKLCLFREWEADDSNNSKGVDAPHQPAKDQT
jgi:NTP pyrophosphatase (non-canonical NTP hydrolase)